MLNIEGKAENYFTRREDFILIQRFALLYLWENMSEIMWLD